MSHQTSLFEAIQNEQPLQIVGVINALTAKLAEQSGFKAIYLSGAGVANVRGLPDLGITSLNDVLHEAQLITQATELPLLVDIDTGWESPLNIERTVRSLCQVGVMGAHLEDQENFKRCGHRDGKKIATTGTMCARIEAAKQGQVNSNFMLMARTDALHYEQEDHTIERVQAYQAAGADAIFLEAVTDIGQYKRFKEAVNLPILANITEFGKTKLYTTKELKQNNVDMVLYPLSAFRAMNQAAKIVFQAIRQEGTQQSVVSMMQTRESLYELIDYENYENKITHFLNKKETYDG